MNKTWARKTSCKCPFKLILSPLSSRSLPRLDDKSARQRGRGPGACHMLRSGTPWKHKRFTETLLPYEVYGNPATIRGLRKPWNHTRFADTLYSYERLPPPWNYNRLTYFTFSPKLIKSLRTIWTSLKSYQIYGHNTVVSIKNMMWNSPALCRYWKTIIVCN